MEIIKSAPHNSEICFSEDGRWTSVKPETETHVIGSPVIKQSSSSSSSSTSSSSAGSVAVISDGTRKFTCPLRRVFSTSTCSQFPWRISAFNMQVGLHAFLLYNIRSIVIDSTRALAMILKNARPKQQFQNICSPRFSHLSRQFTLPLCPDRWFARKMFGYYPQKVTIENFYRNLCLFKRRFSGNCLSK